MKFLIDEKSWPLKFGKNSEHLNSYSCEYTTSKSLPIRSTFVGQAGLVSQLSGNFI